MEHLEEEIQTFIDGLRKKWGDSNVLEALDAVQTGLQMCVDEEAKADE